MSTKHLSVLALAGTTILLAGAGCNLNNLPQEKKGGIEQNTETGVMKKSTNTKNADTVAATMEKTTTLTLRAESQGNRTVTFNFDVSDDTAKDAEFYRIVWGKEENPTFPAQWWYELGPSHREKIWTNLPLGPAHFRVCVVKDKECADYSNDVLVDVK